MRIVLVIYLLIFPWDYLLASNIIPWQELPSQNLLYKGHTIDFSIWSNQMFSDQVKQPAKPLTIRLENSLKIFNFELNEEKCFIIPWNIPNGDYKLTLENISNSAIEVKIDSLIYIHLYGYLPDNRGNVNSGREQVQHLFNLFRHYGKINEYNIDTLFKNFLTIDNINNNLIDIQAGGLHLFYFYGLFQQNDNFLSFRMKDGIKDLKEIHRLIEWDDLDKWIWWHPANHSNIKPKLYNQPNSILLQEPSHQFVLKLSNTYVSTSKYLDKDRGKNFFSFKDLLISQQFYPKISSNELHTWPITSYTWIPKAIITNLKEIKQYNHLTNIEIIKDLNRNFLIFEDKKIKKIKKVPGITKMEPELKQVPGHWE